MSDAPAVIKAKIPQAWALAIIGAITTGGGGVATAHYRLGQVEERAAKSEDLARKALERNNDQALAIQHVSDSVDAMKEDVADIKRSLTRARDRR